MKMFFAHREFLSGSVKTVDCDFCAGFFMVSYLKKAFCIYRHNISDIVVRFFPVGLWVCGDVFRRKNPRFRVFEQRVIRNGHGINDANEACNG